MYGMSSRIFGPENRMLKLMFGPKREEVSGDRRTLPIEDLQNLYPSLQKSVNSKLRNRSDLQMPIVLSEFGGRNGKGRRKFRNAGCDESKQQNKGCELCKAIVTKQSKHAYSQSRAVLWVQRVHRTRTVT